MKKVQEAFDKTAKLLFGAELGQLKAYVGWLSLKISPGRLVKSNSQTLYVADYGGILKLVPDKLVIPLESFDSIGAKKAHLSEKETLASLLGKVGEFARYATDLKEGDNLDVVECTLYKNLVHGYHILGAFDNKCVACISWSDFNESLFGCYRTFYSKFSMHCYHSSKLSCCFEMDSCNSCSCSYFCHNCENLQDCMFCFNVKNLRHAIGNVQVGREKFLEMKKRLQAYLLKELKEKGKVRQSIYHLSE